MSDACAKVFEMNDLNTNICMVNTYFFYLAILVHYINRRMTLICTMQERQLAKNKLYLRVRPGHIFVFSDKLLEGFEVEPFLWKWCCDVLLLR